LDLRELNHWLKLQAAGVTVRSVREWICLQAARRRMHTLLFRLEFFNWVEKQDYIDLPSFLGGR
jgi:hypothetical protein